MAKKKNDKFIIVDDEDTSEIVERKLDSPIKLTKQTLIGIIILILCITTITALNFLPIIKANNYESEYTAFYDLNLERTEYDDVKAPLRLIEDIEEENVYLEKLETIQRGIIYSTVMAILIILYGLIRNPEQKQNTFTDLILSRSFMIIIAFTIYASNSFIGLLFEKLFEERIITLPYIAIYIIIFSIITTILIQRLTAENNNSTNNELKMAKKYSEDIFHLCIIFMIAIPALPIIVGMIAESEDTIYTEQSITIESNSQFKIYEIGIIAQSIDYILNLITAIILLSIIGNLAIISYEKDGQKNPIPHLLSLFSNFIGIICMLIFYQIYVIFINIRNFEEHYNQVFYEGNLDYINFYFTNYLIVIIPLIIGYTWIKYYMLTFKNAYNSLIEKI